MNRVLLAAVLSIALTAFAQKPHPTHTPPHPIQPGNTANEASLEPHHKVVFENNKTRVLRLDLPAGASTETHTHARDYIMIALTPVNARNEFFKSKAQSESNAITMSQGDMQIVKVPQTARILNVGDSPLSILEIEIIEGFHPDLIVCGMGKRGCPSDVGDISDAAHQFSINFLVETDAFRVRDLTIGPGAELPERTAKDPFLRIAVTPVDLAIGGSDSAKMSPGDVQWTPAGDLPKFVNNAKQECRFYEIEFK